MRRGIGDGASQRLDDPHLLLEAHPRGQALGIEARGRLGAPLAEDHAAIRADGWRGLWLELAVRARREDLEVIRADRASEQRERDGLPAEREVDELVGSGIPGEVEADHLALFQIERFERILARGPGRAGGQGGRQREPEGPRGGRKQTPGARDR